jgi:hypothetical protein
MKEITFILPFLYCKKLYLDGEGGFEGPKRGDQSVVAPPGRPV